MKRLIRHGYGIVIVVASALALNGAGAATSYYVSPSGSDGSAGTSLTTPFLHIAHAAALMHPGDTCYIRAGVYRETVTPALSGSSTQPITFTNYNGEAVEVTGLDVLTGTWSGPNASHIFQLASTPAVTDLFWGGQHVGMARYPAETGRPYDSDAWMPLNFANPATSPGTGGQDIAIIPSTPGAAGGAWNGATLVILPDYPAWVTSCGKVSASSATGLTVTNLSQEWRYNYLTNALGTAHGFVTGTLQALQATNQWYQGGGTLYLRTTAADANPSTQTVEGRTRTFAFVLDNLSYVQVTGIAVRAASLSLRNSTHCLVQNCSVRYVMPFQFFTQGFNRDNGVAPDSWEYPGVQVSGSSNRIDSCYIAESFGDGLSVWGTGNTVTNCLVEHTDRSLTDAAAINVTQSTHQIVNNTLRTSGRCIVVHRALLGGGIGYNDLGEGGYGVNDLGITYTFGRDGANTRIFHNWIHDNYASVATKFGPAMYFDSNSTNFFTDHNVVWNCGVGVFVNAGDSGIRSYNNTMWNVPSAVMAHDTPGGDGAINNLASDGPFEGQTLGTNQTYSPAFSPFVDPLQYNFQVLPGTSPVGAGTALGGISEATPPSVGAYETTNTWTAGSTLTPPSFPDVRPSNPDRLAAAQTGWGPAVQLTWRDRSSNETGFNVYRRNQDDVTPALALIASLPAGSTQYLDTLAAPGGFFDYEVRSANVAGESAGTRASIATVSDGSVLRLYARDLDAMSSNGDALALVDGLYLGGCSTGDWVKYAGVDLGAGYTRLRTDVAYASTNTGRGFDIRLDGSTSGYTRVATFQSQNTGSWTTFTEQATTNWPTATSGAHDVYFYFLGGTGVGNFQWFQFEGGNAVGAPYLQTVSVRAANASTGATGALGFAGTTNNWISFPYVNLGQGAESLYLDMATTNSGSIGVHVDATNGPSLGTIAAHSTGGLNVFQSQGTSLASTNGVHTLYLVFSGYGAGQVANVRSYGLTVDAPPKGGTNTPVTATGYGSMSGITNAGTYIGSLDGGDWVCYPGVNFHTRSGSILFNLAAATVPSVPIEAHVDSLTGPLVGVLSPVPTGGWSIFQNQVMPLSGVGGTHDLYLKVPSGAGYGAANIASFTINSQ